MPSLKQQFPSTKNMVTKYQTTAEEDKATKIVEQVKIKAKKYLHIDFMLKYYIPY